MVKDQRQKIKMATNLHNITYTTWYSVPNYYGWICPRCHASNAPFVHRCDCSDNYTETKINIDINMDNMDSKDSTNKDQPHDNN
jgi:hypothetical protein